MRGEIELRRDDFRDTPRMLYRTDGLTVTAFAYPSGVEALKLENRRGHLVVLPYLGQMIWAAAFDGRDLTMKHMFRQPKRAASIIDTYGCFMFHSGLLRNGCPGPDDTHALHGEMPCAPMDRASVVVGADARGAFVEVTGEYEYVQGFGSHYMARPSVRLAEHDAQMTIAMDVTNLGGTPMDLMYMAHLNYAYVPGGRFVQALPRGGLRLRDSVPAHVRPTAPWRDYTATLAHEPERLHTLDAPALYDPEIVFFMNGAETDADEPRISCSNIRMAAHSTPRTAPSNSRMRRAGSCTTRTSRSPRSRCRRPASPRGMKPNAARAMWRRSRPVRRAASKSSPAT